MSDYTLGFLIGFFVVIIIAIVLRCKNNHVTEYDERQLIARNTAY